MSSYTKTSNKLFTNPRRTGNLALEPHLKSRMWLSFLHLRYTVLLVALSDCLAGGESVRRLGLLLRYEYKACCAVVNVMVLIIVVIEAVFASCIRLEMSSASIKRK